MFEERDRAMCGQRSLGTQTKGATQMHTGKAVLASLVVVVIGLGLVILREGTFIPGPLIGGGIIVFVLAFVMFKIAGR